MLFILLFSSVTAYASEEEVLLTPLTDEEVSILKDKVGVSDELINDTPPNELRELIDEGAILKSSFTEIIEIPELINNDSGLYYPYQGGNLDEKKIKIRGQAYDLGTVSSGKYKGYKKIKFSGSWEWLSSPVNAYRDAFAVGWGDSRILIPTNNGSVAEFRGRYYRYDPNQGWYLTESSINTNNFEPNAGTGWTFNLRQGVNTHKGTLVQNAYTRAPSMDSNFKFTYGHAHLLLTPSFGKTTSGFTVTPGITVKTGYHAGELIW